MTAAAAAATSASTAAMFRHVMVHVFVHRNVHGIGLVHVNGMMLLDFDFVRFLYWIRHWLLDSNRYLLLDLLGHQLVDRNSYWLRNWNVDGIRLRDRDFDDLGHWYSDWMRYGYSDFLDHFHRDWFGVFDGVCWDFVVFRATVFGCCLEAASTSSASVPTFFTAAAF